MAWSEYPGLFSGTGYAAWFREDRRLYRITVRWDKPKPSLTQVIDCLGHPEYYQAYYRQDIEARSLNLSLWYVEKGIVVHRTSFHFRESTPAIYPRQIMEMFAVVAPGELEGIARNISAANDDPSWQAHTLCLLRPWPGSIDEIETERFIENHRCKRS